jgi:hypothetical protein
LKSVRRPRDCERARFAFGFRVSKSLAWITTKVETLAGIPHTLPTGILALQLSRKQDAAWCRRGLNGAKKLN